jgi:hypothetical protein
MEGEFWSERYIVILKSTKDYNEAVDFATEAAKKLNLEFENKYIKYSKEKGIFYAKSLPDVMYRGSYYPRRHSGEYISLENSSGYEGLASGYIIVVAGVYNDKESADKALRRIKKFFNNAYVKKANMWMGCIH